MSRLRVPVVALVVATMVVLAGLAFGRIYAGDLLTKLLVGAALGAVAISLALYRLPAYTVAPTSVLALLGYSLYAVKVSAAAGQVTGDLTTLYADALRNSIPRLLTALIPVEPQPDTVFLPVVVAWLAGLAAAELAVRSGRVLFGYLPPTALYVVALVIVGPNARPALWSPLVFAAVAALGLVISRAEQPEAPGEVGSWAFRLRAAIGAGTGLLVVAVLAVAAGPWVGRQVNHTPTDPRKYVHPPQSHAQDENPLSRMSGWAINPTQHLLDARLSAEARIRLAVLNEYDGVTFSVGAKYHNAGRILPATADSGGITAAGPSTTVTQDITIRDLEGGLLPAVATPKRVDGIRVAYDEASGTLLRTEGLADGLAYTVTSARTQPDVNVLPTADVPSGPAVARFLNPGASVPQEIIDLANKIAEAAGTAYEKATALEQFLAAHYKFDANAASGHALPNLKFFLLDPRNTGGQRGTSEQFAAAYAVLGRLIGLPTRVVVGFKARAGDNSVTGADALAWPEVLFTGAGWVAFNPMPQADTRALEEDYKPKPPPSKPPSSPPAVPTPTVSATQSAATGPHDAGAPAETGLSPAAKTAIGTGGGLLLVALALVTVLFLRAGRRRDRLARGSPSARVLGAWLEVRDALRLARHRVPAHLAATEIAAYAADTTPRSRRPAPPPPPLPPLRALADLVNIVGFAPDLVDERDAHTATSIADAYVSALRARRPWWRRALWSVSPRPLWWGPKIATPPHRPAVNGVPPGPGTPPPLVPPGPGIPAPLVPAGPGTQPPAFLRPAHPEPLTAAAFPPFPGPPAPAPAQWPTAPPAAAPALPAAAPVAPDGGYAHTGEHQQYAAPGERFSPLERDGSVPVEEHGRHHRDDDG